MRIIKKSLALLIALTMVLSVIGVSVFADDPVVSVGITVDSTNVGQTKSAVFTFTYTSLKGEDFKSNNSGLRLEYNPAVVTPEIVSTATGITGNINATKNQVNFAHMGVTFTVPTTGVEYCKVKFTVAADAATGSTKLFTIATAAESVIKDENQVKVLSTLGEIPSVNILKAFTVANVDAVSAQTAELGDTKASIVEKLSALEIGVKGSDPSTESASLKATGWTCAEMGDTVEAAGAYTFTGTLQGTDVVNVPADKATVTATVNVGKITLTNEMVTSTYANVEVPQAEEAATLDAEGAKALLTSDYMTATISKGGKYEETNATVAWAGTGSLDLKKLTKDEPTNKLTLTGTVTPAADGNYTSTATVTIEVVVVPANIPGGTIKVNNPIENGKAKVTVTVPAAEIAKLTEGAEIVATIAAKNGTDPAATASVALEAEDIAAAKAENPVDYKAVLTVDKSMKTLGYAKDDTFRAYVTVAGTALLNGTGDDAVDYAEGTVVKATSGGGSNFNPGSAPTTPTEPTKPTEPTEPTKPTDPTEPTKPTEPTTPADKFNDVEDSFWAAEDIYLLKEAGIINGKSASEFDPEGKVTRAEFTKMIAQLFGVEAISGAVKFEDCGDADWFTPYVAAAVEAGLVTGYSDTEFAPDKTITREEACTIIGRGLKAVAEGELTFTDASDISDYAAEYVAILAAKGFINGYEDGSFLPANEITRAESAKIVANVFKSLKAEAEAEAPAEAETEAEAPAEAEAEAEAPAEAE